MIFLICAVAVTLITFAIPYLLVNHTPSPTHLWKLGIVGSVSKYLFSFVGVLLTYLFAKVWPAAARVEDNWLSELKQYLICIGVCGLIGLVAGRDLGTHTEDRDPYFGGGEVVEDYVPTDDQRIQHGLILFFGLSIPALFGIKEGLAELRKERRTRIRV